MIEKAKKLKALAETEGKPSAQMTRSKTSSIKGSTPKSIHGKGKGGKK